MKVNVRDFLRSSYNHGDSITIINNLPSNEVGDVYKVLWEGKYETIDHSIPEDIVTLEVVKWGIDHNGIVIFVNYKREWLLI